MSDNQFDASSSMLGYFYQVRYALFLILTYIREGNFTKQIKIEGLDDIELSEENEILQLLQTKHLTGKKLLTDSSKHFWKTIRIWSNHIIDGKINPVDTYLAFVINSEPSKNSIIQLLSEDKKDVEEIVKKMNDFIDSSKSKDKTIKDCYASFNKLTNIQKKELLSSISVLALQPDIEKLLDEDISRLLIPFVWSNHLESFSSNLDAWWFHRVVKHITENLKTDDSLTISSLEVYNKTQDLRDNYNRNSLPLHYEGKDVELPSDYEDYTYVKQLRKLDYTDDIIDLAKRDYYKANGERGLWEKKYIFPEEIETYERKLREAWDKIYKFRKNKYRLRYKLKIEEITDNEILQEFGMNVYEETLEKVIPFKNITAEYFINGSYHILANMNPIPRIYWHPKFIEPLKNED